MTEVADEIYRLLNALLEPTSFLGRLTGTRTPSEEILRRISELLHEVTPAQLALLDEQARGYTFHVGRHDSWWKLQPEAIPTLVKTTKLHPLLIGILTFHRNGHVRSTALEELAQIVDGRELPFLSIRANDWVEPIASRAAELLVARMRPANRSAVVGALPFILRMLCQHRRDHRSLIDPLKTVLLSDLGREVLARASKFDSGVRRTVFALITADEVAYDRHVVDAALSDIDPVIRARALKRLAGSADARDVVAVLDRLLRHDPSPAIRKMALTTLVERAPSTVGEVLPVGLLDRTASVRAAAQFIVRTQTLGITLRDFYVDHLSIDRPTHLAATIAGVSETGTRGDLELLAQFAKADATRIRRAALLAHAKLDIGRAIPLAIDALEDAPLSVQGAAIAILIKHAPQVDFELVHRRWQMIADSRTRQRSLRLLACASKWDAAAYLVEALSDSDTSVRATALRLVNVWLDRFNRAQTQPTRKQLQRITDLLNREQSHVPAETLHLMKFMISGQ